MDFNADLGESFGLWERGADDALMRVISSANVACGFHAGDPGAMRRAVASALEHGVKPHGALYMQALDDAGLARAVAEAVAAFDETLTIYTLAGSELAAAAEAAGVRPVPEFFADRPLREDGTVVMFGWQPLFDPTPEAVGERVRSLVETGTVPALDGTPVPVDAETVCVHSDTPRAGELGAAVRASAEAAGATITAESFTRGG